MGMFGKYNNLPPFSEPTTQLLSRDLAMLRGLRMARIRPSRLRILNAGVKIRIGFTKKSFFKYPSGILLKLPLWEMVKILKMQVGCYIFQKPEKLKPWSDLAT